MYVCMCVCVYACMDGRTHARTHVCMYVLKYIRFFAHTHLLQCQFMPRNANMIVFKCTCMCTYVSTQCTNVNTCKYVNICVQIHIYTYIYIYIRIYRYVSIHIFKYAQTCIGMIIYFLFICM